MGAKLAGPLRYSFTGGEPDSPAPSWHAWYALGTGTPLVPPAIDDPTGQGLWGFVWDAAAQGEAEGWLDWGVTVAERWERVTVTAESAAILAGGPTSSTPGIVVVG